MLALRLEIRQMLALAAPLILAQLAQTSMGFVDTVMVGRLGDAALAGIALGSTVFFFVMIIMMGVIFAVSPTVSQAHGAGQAEDVGRATRQGLWLAGLLALPAFLLFRRADALLLLMGQGPEVVAMSAGYLKAVSWGIFPVLWFTALRGMLEGLSITRPIMVLTFLGVGLNILANSALMFGRWGFPALGLVGTGYATAVVYGAMFLLGCLYIAIGFGKYKVFAKLRQPDIAMLKDLLVIGLPIGLSLGFEASLFATTALLMGLIGQVQLAAHQIAIQTASLTFMVPVGLSIATSVRVGQAAGAGELSRLRRSAYVGMGLSLFFMCITALAFWLTPDFITSLYLDLSDPDNAEVARFAAAFLGVAAMFQLFDGLQVSSAGALRGLKDTRVPMLLTLLAYWPVGIGVAVLLAFGFDLGGRGLWLGLVAGLATAAGLLLRRFRRLTREGANEPAAQGATSGAQLKVK